MTKSDHEIIAFSLMSKNVQKIDSSLNTLYNVQKAGWNNFIKNLQLNYASAKAKMQKLIQSSNIENIKKMILLLRSTIEDAINENISKRRSCNQSKVWWSNELANKRKSWFIWKDSEKILRFCRMEIYSKNQDIIILMQLEKQKIYHEQIF